jgi:hypothetical protein
MAVWLHGTDIWRRAGSALFSRQEAAASGQQDDTVTGRDGDAEKK